MQWRPKIDDWFEFSIAIFLLSVSFAILLLSFRIFFVGFH